MTPEEEISEIIYRYLAENPDFVELDQEFVHPSVMSMHQKIKPILIKHYGGNPLRYWSALLDAAKVWFPEKNQTKLGQLFCTRFEIEGCTFWNDIPEYQPLMEEYNAWRGLNK